MTKTTKITLSGTRDIPFSQLRLSQSNVRRIQDGQSIEELAEDIARRGLLQSLSVRPKADEAGIDTGLFEVPAGGRRFRALERLVKQKRMAKDAPVPCIVRTDGMAEEDSLAENVQRLNGRLEHRDVVSGSISRSRRGRRDQPLRLAHCRSG